MSDFEDHETNSLPHIEVVAGLIWRQDGKILTTMRPLSAEHGGLWEFPGGKMEPGESPDLALVREIREELDIIVEPGPEFARVKHKYEDKEITLIGLHARHHNGRPTLLGVSDFRWVSPEDIYTFPLAEADRKLLALGQLIPPDRFAIQDGSVST